MDLQRLRNSKGEIWVNCASGHYVLPEFVNYDNSLQLRLLFLYPLLRLALKRNGSADNRFQDYQAARKKNCLLFVHDCSNPFDLPNESVDHILVSHFLEHLYHDEAKQVLHEFRRILKPAGTLHVIVPDIHSRAENYSRQANNENAANEFVRSLIFNYPTRPPLLTRFLEMIGGFGLFHRWMYDKTSMRAMLAEGGFSLCEANNSPSARWREEDNAGQVNLLARKPGH